jgi:uncharacterized repeat protein (TIGR01451 family)
MGRSPQRWTIPDVVLGCTPIPAGLARPLLAAVAAVALAWTAATPARAATGFAAIDDDGPLSHLSISSDLNCQVLHTADAQAEFYPSLDFDQGACGTALSVGGTLFGPSDITGGPDPVDFVPVSQSPVSGSGTASDPYVITTVVTAGPSVQITEKDSYVEGTETWRTDVTLKNIGTATVSPILYRFGDCYLHEDDTGFGVVSGSTVACATATGDPKAGTLSWVPITAGSHHYEGVFSGLYGAMTSNAALPDTCDCTTRTENAAGLSWSTTLAKNVSKTFSHTTTASPLGPDAVAATGTVFKTEVLNSTIVTYTLTYTNPTAAPVAMSELADRLPAGFTYVVGSSSGTTLSDPAIDPTTNRLTWDGTFNVPAGGALTQKFKATATGAAGPLNFDRVDGTAAIRVAPSGPTAAVRICTFVDAAGAHTISGTSGDDVLCASDGNDTVDAGAGNDVISGGPGNDTLTGGPGADVIVGGTGTDTVLYGPSVTAPVTIDLTANGANDGATGEGDDVGADVENATGGAGADTILGNSAANLLLGGDGADAMAGRGGTDTLRGNLGYDTLTGNDDGSTADTLDCGTNRGKGLPGPNDTVINCDP